MTGHKKTAGQAMRFFIAIHNFNLSTNIQAFLTCSIK